MYGMVSTRRAGTLQRRGWAEQVAKLRERVESQVKQWEAEVQDLEGRVDAIQVEARSRVGAQVECIDAQLKRWDMHADEPEQQAEPGQPARSPQDTLQYPFRQWCCELGELRASAYKADAQAQQAYQHQITTLRASIEGQVQAWQQELTQLHVAADTVWTEALSNELAMTQRKLGGQDEASATTWQGFAGEVEEVLRQAERVVRQAAGVTEK